MTRGWLLISKLLERHSETYHHMLGFSLCVRLKCAHSKLEPSICAGPMKEKIHFAKPSVLFLPWQPVTEHW